MSGWQKLFVCAICDKHVDDIIHRNGRERQLDPLCRYCEGAYSNRSPESGAFMDRRKACQISALANALRGNAGIKQWENKHYGRS